MKGPLYYFSKLFFKLTGWKVSGTMPPEIKKAVIIVAPHTSNWDFVIGKMLTVLLGMKAKFLIKEELFKFPLGPVLRWLGAIPVPRGNSAHMINHVAKYFNDAGSLYIIITPEGTRKPRKNWKKGFYYIALRAKVPVILGVLDYEKKEGGVGEIFYPSGDMEKDMEYIYDFYRNAKAKYPENFAVPGKNEKKH